MRKFLLKSLIAVTIFSFLGFGGVTSSSNFGTITVQAQQSIVSDLGNPTVYYTPKGKSDPCDFCVEYTSATTSSNTNNNLTTSVSNSNTQKNNVVKLNVNKEGLKEYLQNAYKKAFKRDIDDEGSNYWMNQLSQGKVTIKDFILNLIGSDEFNGLNLGVEETIKRAYEIMFGRDADGEGLNYWINQFNKNLKNNNPKKAIIFTVNEMMKSDELKQIVNKIGVLY